jgi:hypothetical protein
MFREFMLVGFKARKIKENGNQMALQRLIGNKTHKRAIDVIPHKKHVYFFKN